MITADSLIFEGKYTLTFSGDLVDRFKRLQHRIIEYLETQNFISTTHNVFTSHNFLNMKFTLAPDKNMQSSEENILHHIGIKKSFSKQYEIWLERKRVDTPFEVDIQINAPDSNSLTIRVLSKPVGYVRIAKNGLNSKYITEEVYSYIKSENIEFIKAIMVAIGATEVQPPRAKCELVKFRLSDKLREHDLNSLADLLDKGYSKVINRKIDEGLADLRSALEKIMKEFVKQIGEKPVEKITDNIDILRGKNYIDDRTRNLIKNTLVDYLYSYLSDKPTHNRDKIALLNEIDAKYAYALFEDSLELLLNKIYKRL